jgi:dihydroneopterin aldolase
MIGTAGVRQLQLDCIVGIYPHERAAEQPVLLDLEIDYDFAAAAASDAIADALDYDVLVASVTQLIKSRQFQLIETMAEEAAALLLNLMPQVRAVRLEIRKPAAVPTAQYSFVRIERTRT